MSNCPADAPEPEHCWCGGVIILDSEGNKTCSNADPNEVGP